MQMSLSILCRNGDIALLTLHALFRQQERH